MAIGGSLIGALRFILGADTANLEAATERVSASLRGVVAAGTAMGTAIGNIAVQAATALARALNDAAKRALELVQAADKLGIPAENLSRLQYAAEQVGVSAHSLRDGLEQLREKIREAAHDAGTDAARAFAAMGISLRTATGEIRPVDDVLRDLVGRLQSYSDSANRTRLGTTAMGGAFETLEPIVRRLGVEGLERLARASDATGNTLSGPAAQAARTYQQIVLSLTNSLNGITTTIINAFGPTIANLINYFNNAYTSGGLLKGVIDALAAAFRVLAQGVVLANGTLQEIGGVIATVATALKQLFVDWDPSKAAETMRQGFTAIGQSMRQALEAAQGLATTAPPLVTGLGQLGAVMAPSFRTGAEAARDLAERLRHVREELADIMADPTIALEDRLAKIQAAFEAGAISAEVMARRVREAIKANAEAMESTLRTVASAITAVFSKSKPAAIAAALINTYVGITQALRSLPPPWSFIQAAAVGAMGFAQVRNITSTTESGGGGSTSVSTPSEAAGTPSQMLTVEGLSGDGLIDMMSVRGLAERLLQYQRDGGQVVLA